MSEQMLRGAAGYLLRVGRHTRSDIARICEMSAEEVFEIEKIQNRNKVAVVNMTARIGEETATKIAAATYQLDFMNVEDQ